MISPPISGSGEIRSPRDGDVAGQKGLTDLIMMSIGCPSRAQYQGQNITWLQLRGQKTCEHECDIVRRVRRNRESDRACFVGGIRQQRSECIGPHIRGASREHIKGIHQRHRRGRSKVRYRREHGYKISDNGRGESYSEVYTHHIGQRM